LNPETTLELPKSADDDYKARVIAEKGELDKKLEKLGAFIRSEESRTSKSVSEKDLELLKEQAHYMICYSTILQRRIERF